MKQHILTEAEAAAYLQLSRGYLRQTRMTTPPEGLSSGPPWIRLGRRVRYLKEDLDQWVRASRVERGRPR